MTYSPNGSEQKIKKQDFFWLQANQTAFETVIGATVDIHVDNSVSENIYKCTSSD